MTDKKEAPKKGDLSKLYEILGAPPRVLSPAERDQMEAALKRLKEASERDPGWKKAGEAWIKAEAEHGKDDPCEGRIVKAPKPPGK